MITLVGKRNDYRGMSMKTGYPERYRLRLYFFGVRCILQATLATGKSLSSSSSFLISAQATAFEQGNRNAA